MSWAITRKRYILVLQTFKDTRQVQCWSARVRPVNPVRLDESLAIKFTQFVK